MLSGLISVATPTEAAGFGAFGVVILGILFRVTWDVLVKSFAGASRHCDGSTIILASTTFSQLLAFTGASAGLIEWATKVDLSPLVVFIMFIL